MLVLSLDTTTRRGSAALRRDGVLVDCELGDGSRTHGERLPGDLMRLLDRNDCRPADVDLFAVAAGPGSFTGLRIGIATMQGFALANGRKIVGVSALEALNAAVGTDSRLVGAMMDAQRGQVFAALYRANFVVDAPCVDAPDVVLARWTALAAGNPVILIGDGALAYENLVSGSGLEATVVPDVPPIAPAIARLAEEAAARGEAIGPEAIRPLYIRRPDAELARDRARGAETLSPEVPRA